MAKRRLLTVGHSYAVALNRRLASEIANASSGAWEVTAAAPAFMHGDLRPIPLELSPGEACRLEPIPARFTNRPHIMAYGRKLRSLLRGSPWDLVHCWEEPYVYAGWQFARWAGDAPSVFYSFQNISKRYPPPFAWMERSSVRRSAGWIAAGETVAETLLRRPHYAGRPHATIPLGVDRSVFRPDPAAGGAIRKRLGWEPVGPPVVGFLGRFIPAKGLELLTAAMERVASPWRALFVGGGPMEEWLRGWAAPRGEQVRIVTGVAHGDVPPYLNAMDLLAAPSQTTPKWREQLGRMLLEAFAVGVPVLGTDSGEIPHVVGDAGLVLPEQDVDAWTAALAELIDDPARRAELRARGLERAESFSWPVIARRHLEFFNEVLATKRP